MLHKDKQKVIGEELSDDRIKGMLDLRNENGEVDDFHLLTRAYRALRADDFARFIQFYCAAGHSVDAEDNQGTPFLSVLKTHEQAAPYREILINAGAKA
ncbi:PA4642 family protein [Aestuariirhabdus sp. Z084]|uniref:PA4642 family protein n=1 Tax=Aestuariirhabdus haliotis TaxID=2918751 RepID=UPI00201B3B37|nr:PA4642 family protein [Aestuariirhabdus haliotis]MCL6415204.1 PA4642 family protein [Aestuariirhabdus haliotis]MCL6420079.1 PA4642 family protein [Aestuariirhabdus haliotis]